MSQSASRSVRQSVSQTLSQTVSKLFGRSLTQSVNHEGLRSIIKKRKSKTHFWDHYPLKYSPLQST